MTKDDSIMQIIRERVGKHGYTESAKKPGLFYKNIYLTDTDENKITLYVDCRRSRTQYYGFGGDEKLSQNIIDKAMKDIRLDLASIGITELEQFRKVDEGFF